MTGNFLLAFDFDHTLIEENSDLYVKKLAPNGIPKDIEDQYSHLGWTNYMASVFTFLHENGVNQKNIEECLSEICLTAGMKELIRFAGDNHHECIIISDANSIFIDFILDRFGLKSFFSRLYTNPAKFDQDGRLTIEYYHTQDWCKLSTVNLCKGHILQEHIKQRMKEGVQFHRVFYVGDGTNDLCPSLTLHEKDFCCPRINYSLWKKIQKMKNDQDKENAHVIKAQVLNWETGHDLLETIKMVDKSEI